MPSTCASYKRGLQQRLRSRMLALLRVAWLVVFGLALALTTHPSVLLQASWLRLAAQWVVIMPAWSAVGLVSLLPVLILRKKHLRLQPDLQATRLDTFVHLLSAKETVETVLAFGLSSVALFTTWWQLCKITAPQPELQLWYYPDINSSTTRAPQLNPRLAFIATSTVLFSVVSAVRHVWAQHNVLHFDKSSASSQLKISQRVAAGLSGRVRDSVMLSVAWSSAWPVVWMLFKRPLLRTFIYPTPFRPFFAALYKQLGLSPSTLLRAGSACLFCSIAWDALNVLFDAYLSQPVIISHMSPTPNATLIDGLQQSDAHAQHMAYLELVQVVTSDPARRAAIFDDTAQDPAALALIMRICTAQLGKDRARVLNPSAQSAAAAPVVQSAPQPTHPSLPSVPVMSGGVVQQSRSHFLDRFAKTPTDPALSSSSGQPSAGSNGAPPPQANGADSGPVPSILQNLPKASSSSANGTAPQSSASSSPATQEPPPADRKKEILSFLVRKAVGEKSKAALWLLEPLPLPPILQALPQPELDAWIAQTLSCLLVHSLSEDKYGLAQKELPKTLEGMVQFASAVEMLVKTHQDKPEVLQAHVQPVLMQSQTALSDVVLAFKPFLKEFRFSQETGAKIKHVLDWR